MAMVLVVDDEAPIVDLLVDIIEEQGHTALRAGNGAEALLVARASRPDVIISDVMMPSLDGYTLLERVRATPELARVRVVLMSAAFPANEAGGGARSAEQPATLADAYLRKPFDIVAVEAILARFVAQGQQH
jgi:CheY-like chemotaxis protein